MTHRSVPAPFLSKTYLLVDDPGTDDVISWNENGTAFVVWKTAEFAKDLLPNSFKHNNFSSFVRQLNTYGFRKIVPDKWEFANDNFKRGHRELLIEISRRKNVPLTKAGAIGKPGGDGCLTSSPTSSSSNDVKSSSTSSPDSKNPGSVDTSTVEKLENLSDENEKLKKEKLILTLELAHMKKQCDDLVAFLTQNVKVAPDQINHIMKKDDVVSETVMASDDSNDDDEKVECIKLFGVMLKDEKKKRVRDEINNIEGGQNKETKMNEYHNTDPGMNPYFSTKVCN
ncbi:heat shock factor protein HSF24-like [Rutidosis leptorrhynchoides]|uniref:heat shock factor protein HSF24-like n=1 Tax=Rutidosis leptorrhynchoides TaxID=125765 RepID=UPI003A9A1731